MRCLISGSEQPSYQAGDRRWKLSAQLHINHHHHHENIAKSKTKSSVLLKPTKHLQQGIRERIPNNSSRSSNCGKVVVWLSQSYRYQHQFQNQHQFSQVLSKILISHSHTIQATKASVSKGWRIELLSIAEIIQITGHSGHHCFGFGVDALELIMQCKANAQQSRNEYRLPAHWRTCAHIVARGSQWTHRLRQNWQKFTHFLAACNFYRLACTAANKYLNAIINKCERVGKTKKRRVEVEFMEGAKCIWAWGRFLGADCRWRWVKW